MRVQTKSHLKTACPQINPFPYQIFGLWIDGRQGAFPTRLSLPNATEPIHKSTETPAGTPASNPAVPAKCSIRGSVRWKLNCCIYVVYWHYAKCFQHCSNQRNPHVYPRWHCVSLGGLLLLVSLQSCQFNLNEGEIIFKTWPHLWTIEPESQTNFHRKWLL